MSWTIAVIKNEPKISKKCAKDLLNVDPECIWDDVESITEDGTLYMNPDHNEGMGNFLNYKEVQKVLKKHKIKGDICFGSLEGDNEGSYWGYRFDGKGGMTELTADVEWREVEWVEDEV